VAKYKTEKKSSVGTKKRYIGEDIVTHTLYDGHSIGHGGSYMTGSVKDELVKDKNGKPLPLKTIGILK
jgi:hypothetical protein